jgi:hypothetical protein
LFRNARARAETAPVRSPAVAQSPSAGHIPQRRAAAPGAEIRPSGKASRRGPSDREVAHCDGDRRLPRPAEREAARKPLPVRRGRLPRIGRGNTKGKLDKGIRLRMDTEVFGQVAVSGVRAWRLDVAGTIQLLPIQIQPFLRGPG